MRFLVDEGVDGPIVARLRNDEHQVWYVAEMAPGLPDEAVLELANQEQAVLITADKDFGELVFRQQRVARNHTYSPGRRFCRRKSITCFRGN